MIPRMKVSVIDFSCNNFQNLAKVQDVFAEYISSFLYIDNEEDKTKNVMDNAGNFPSSFVSEELQGEQTKFTILAPTDNTTSFSNTHSQQKNCHHQLFPSRHHLFFYRPHFFFSHQHQHRLLHQRKIVTLEQLLQHINMLEQEQGQ